jgi:hypothetical protein
MGGGKRDLSTFAGRLAWILDQEGHGSRKAAAERVGVSPQRFSDWTDPTNRNPSFASLQTIARAFPHVRMEWLITNDGQPYRREEEARVAIGRIRGLLDEVEEYFGGSSNAGSAEPPDQLRQKVDRMKPTHSDDRQGLGSGGG